MSDNDEFLGDDFGDTGADETYNLGNEEEEMLLAGGDISKPQIDVENRSEERDVLAATDNEKHEVYTNTEKVTERLPPALENQGPRSTGTVKQYVDNRYRATERFPSERRPGAANDLIPDSDAINPQFRNKKIINNKNKRINNPRSLKRLDIPRHQNQNFKPVLGGDFKPYPRDINTNRGPRPKGPPGMRPRDFNSRGVNPNFHPRQGFNNPRFTGDFRPSDPRLPGPFGNARPFHNNGSDLENRGLVNIRTSVDVRTGAANVHRELLNQPSGHFDSANRFRPQNFNPMENKMIHRDVVPFNTSRNFNVPSNNYVSREFERKGISSEPTNLPLFDSNLPPNSKNNFYGGPMNEPKKVHINPHFKGAVPPMTEFIQNQNMNEKPIINKFESNDYNIHGETSVYMQNKSQTYINNPLESTNDLERIRNIGYGDNPLSDKEHERLTEQFINEQQRCLQKANADFYEKTQRFIESTSLPIRNNIVIDDADRKKEYLKRKQEEFINENDKFLNNRRRRVTPPRTNYRSSSPPPRHRSSPYRKTDRRPRSPSPSSQNNRESSVESVDKAYRAKLREQAEMRARVLQAKERRRRRDAATLIEKMSQTANPSQEIKQNNKLSENDPSPTTKRMENNDSSAYISTDSDKASKNVLNETDSDLENKLSKNSPKQKNVETKDLTSKSENDDKQGKTETLEDMLEDDLLRLSPEDEELLLSDGEDLTLPTNFTKPLTSSESSGNKSSSLNNKIFSKDIQKEQTKKNSSSLNNSNVSVANKRPANFDTKEDLRSKIKKNNENQSYDSENVSPHRRIIFSGDKDADTPQTNETDKVKKEPERVTENKWRSTFSEQKLDLTAPVAVRAISAVMRNTTENKKNVMNKSKQLIAQKETNQEDEKITNKLQNGSPTDKTWNGRQVVISVPGRRVVIPPRQKPLVIVENDEDDPQDGFDSSRSEKIKNNKKSAQITGLPPGMTEARLLSLCGPEVEHVTMGAAGSAEAIFNSPDACERFVRRFHGRLVAACRLSVTVME